MKSCLSYSIILMCFIGQLSAQQLSFERVYADEFKSEFYPSDFGKFVKGDLDNDGDIDVIITALNGSSAYINDGLGNYTIESYLFSPVSWSRDLGDIDGDGDLDFVTSGELAFNQYKTDMMLNDGNGNFTVSQQTLPSVTFSATIFGDVDGDNDLDLFITGQGERGTIITELYLNDGLGGFSLDTNNIFQQLKNSDAIFFDIDNDSDLDLIYSGEDLNGLKFTTTYKNNGFGYFSVDTTNTLIGISAGKLFFADIDNDGDNDFLILDAVHQNLASQVFLYSNNGSGLFSLDSTTSFPNMSWANLSILDINNDNKLDMIFTGSINNTAMTQVFNFESGQLREDTLIDLIDVQYGFVIPLHLNTDVFEDLVVFGNQPSSGSFAATYLSDQNGGFYEKKASNIEGLRWGVVEHADIDGDQDQDLFMTGNDVIHQAKSLLYKNDGSGNFQLSNSQIIGVKQGQSVFADLDQDLDMDLIITGRDINDVPQSKIYFNDGQGNYTEDTVSKLEGVYHSSVAVTDFNNDGEQDIIITGNLTTSSSRTKLYFGQNGVFVLDTTCLIKDLGFGSISVADVDGDSDIDVFISGEDTDSNSVGNWSRSALLYINDGSGNFALSLHNDSLFQVSGGVSELADLDNDGDFDLVFTGHAPAIPGGTYVYLNNGLGKFTQSSFYAGNLNVYQQVLSDFDNDNDLDIIMKINNNIGSQVYLNDNSGNFSPMPNHDLLFSVNGGAAYFDVDGDNDIDVLFSGISIFGTNTFFLYRNNLISKVGLEKRSIKDQFMLFPNPSNGVISIVDDNQEIERLELYNLNGQLITSRELSQNTSHQIELPEQKGIYLLMIYTENNQSAQRVVRY